MRRVAAAVVSPLRAFLHAESAGGVVLVVAAVAALVWANSPVAGGYCQFWHQTISVGAGTARITEDLQHWVNDGLMVIFSLSGFLLTGQLYRADARGPLDLAAR